MDGSESSASDLFFSRLPWTVQGALAPFRDCGTLQWFSADLARWLCVEIVPSPRDWEFVMAFDIDGGFGEDAWREAGVCAPNFVVGRPGTGRCHFIYVLKTGVSRQNRKAAKYFDAIRRAYTAALIPYGADPAYRNHSVHNPGSSFYRHVRLREAPYDLDELAVYADFHAPLPDSLRSWRRMPSRTPAAGSRNVAVFDAARFAAYPVARGGGERSDLERAARAAALACNGSFEIQLGEREVAGIVSSVVRWCMRMFGRVCDAVPRARRTVRGVVDRATWRQQAVERSQAAVRLRALGLTIASIAREIGVSTRSVLRYLAGGDTCAPLSGVKVVVASVKRVERVYVGPGRRIVASFSEMFLEKIWSGYYALLSGFIQTDHRSFKRGGAGRVGESGRGCRARLVGG